MHNNNWIKIKEITRCLSTQACRKLSEEDCKQSIGNILDQCSNIFRDMHNKDFLKCRCLPQLKCDYMRNIFFDFIIAYIKMSKRDQEESARNIISRGLSSKAGIPRGRVVSMFTLTHDTQEKIFYCTRT